MCACVCPNALIKRFSPELTQTPLKHICSTQISFASASVIPSPSTQGNSVINAQVSESGTKEDDLKMGLRNHTIMERTLDDVFLSGTRASSSSSGGDMIQYSKGNNNNNTATIDKLPLIPLMKLDAQGGQFPLIESADTSFPTLPLLTLPPFLDHDHAC